MLCVVGAITLIELAGGGAFDRRGAVDAGQELWHRFAVWRARRAPMDRPAPPLGRLEDRVSDHAIGALDALVATSRAGGSAALAILAAAVVIGNARSVTQLLKMKDAVALELDVERFHGVVSFMIKSFFLLYRFDVVAALVADRCRRRVGPRPACGPLAPRRSRRCAAGFSKGERGLVVCAARYGGWRAGDPPGSGGYLRYAGAPRGGLCCVVVTILAFAVGMPVMTQRIEQEAAATDGDDDSDGGLEALPLTATERSTESAPAELEHPTVPLTQPRWRRLRRLRPRCSCRCLRLRPASTHLDPTRAGPWSTRPCRFVGRR